MILEDFLSLSQVVTNSGLCRRFHKFNNCNTLGTILGSISKIGNNFLGVTPTRKPLSLA